MKLIYSAITTIIFLAPINADAGCCNGQVNCFLPSGKQAGTLSNLIFKWMARDDTLTCQAASGDSWYISKCNNEVNDCKTSVNKGEGSCTVKQVKHNKTWC